MAKRNWALTAVAVALLTAGISTTTAWSNPRLNHLTFNGAVALPGVTLPAGTYVFEVVGNSSDVVRVSSKQGRHYFLGFTQRIERPAGERSQPIAAWYPIGSSRGHRFLYPR